MPETGLSDQVVPTKSPSGDQKGPIGSDAALVTLPTGSGRISLPDETLDPEVRLPAPQNKKGSGGASNGRPSGVASVHQMLETAQIPSGQRTVESIPVQTSRGPIVGRHDEIRTVESCVSRALTQGSSLLLEGEAGLGKSTLLRWAADSGTTAGMRVLEASGVEFEAGLPFSGLNQAFRPVLPEMRRLTDHHRHALSAALGLVPTVSTNRFTVLNAALEFMQIMADVQPVLLVVDDSQWLDRPTETVLAFVARRLQGSPIGMIVASRPHSGGIFEEAVANKLELQPLNQLGAAQLLDSHYPDLHSRTRRWTLQQAQGNPLALLELPSDFRRNHARYWDSSGTTMPLGSKLRAAFASRIYDLPMASRRLLLVAALEGTGDLGIVKAASPADDLGDLDRAERLGLVAIQRGEHRLSFRHPLIKRAVVDSSTHSERRSVHTALAEALISRPTRRAWHLGEATVGPDECVASLLEEAGRGVQRQGDPLGAVRRLLRAADLSPRPADRSRRLAEAAYICSDIAGGLADASRLLADAKVADPDTADSLQTVVGAAHGILYGEGDIDTAHRLLVSAIEAEGDRFIGHDPLLTEALFTLLIVCYFGGRDELWEPFDAALRRFTPEPPLILAITRSTFADPANATPADLKALDAAIAGLHAQTDSAAIVRVGRAAVYVDRIFSCRPALERVIREASGTGAVASAIHALLTLALDDYVIGEWDDALILADQGLALCEEHGYLLPMWPLLFAKGQVGASRGDREMVGAVVKNLTRSAAPRRAQRALLYASCIRAAEAMGRGDFESAYVDLSQISPPGTLPARISTAIVSGLNLVEAAARTDRWAEAKAHARVMRDAGLGQISERLALVTIGATAIAERSTEAFEEALALPGQMHWVPDSARIHLAYGEHLRRTRATKAARAHLSTALELFERLGAHQWATRAANELEASGVAVGITPDEAFDGLTALDRQIAQLVVAGLTNKEIGQRLYLSHRTVGGHLSRMYPKLGVKSRAALARSVISGNGQPDRR